MGAESREPVTPRAPRQGDRNAGAVVQIGDGIVQVEGLAGCMAGEAVELAPGCYAVASILQERFVSCAMLDHAPHLRPGDPVRGTGLLPRTPCGPGLLGRVVDPLGRPLDGGGPVAAVSSWPLDFPGAGLAERQPVCVGLQTGVKAVDALACIGRGQCRPLVGERRSGKTALALDAILAQKESGVLCVYVAVGQPGPALAERIGALREGGALPHTTVVSAGPTDPPALRRLAPFAGCSLAEFFTWTEGRDTLVVIDDLTRHALAHAELSSLLGNPPGRDMQPADRLSVLGRLLERAVARAERWVIVRGDGPGAAAREEDAVNGVVYSGPLERERAERTDLPRHPGCRLARVAGSGGSLTALPIVESGSDAAADLVRDVVGLSDGALFLRAELFRAGIYPALEPASLQGGGPAVPAMRYLRKGLTLAWQAMRELEDFAGLGAELDRATRALLERGHRIVELLRQPPGRPVSLREQILVLGAGVFGHLDGVPREFAGAFVEGLVAYAHAAHPGVLRSLDRPRLSYDELRRDLGLVVADFHQRSAPHARWFYRPV
jgi:F-type H+-transporting ATPase subunit alpha